LFIEGKKKQRRKTLVQVQKKEFEKKGVWFIKSIYESLQRNNKKTKGFKKEGR